MKYPTLAIVSPVIGNNNFGLTRSRKAKHQEGLLSLQHPAQLVMLNVELLFQHGIAYPAGRNCGEDLAINILCERAGLLVGRYRGVAIKKKPLCNTAGGCAKARVHQNIANMDILTRIKLPYLKRYCTENDIKIDGDGRRSPTYISAIIKKLWPTITEAHIRQLKTSYSRQLAKEVFALQSSRTHDTTIQKWLKDYWPEINVAQNAVSLNRRM